MPRKATIGPAVFERVNQLVSEGKSRTEAFTQIAQERSSRPGTIAANYYRTARAQPSAGGARRRTTRTRRASAPRRPAAAAPAAAPARAADGDIGALANQISDLVAQLVRQVQERDQRLRELLG
ncbi:MAG TPA: hypothetical protein VGI72_07195 [Gaiellales bacterium]|jgi:uncharacterized protein YoaH (UPF0181 family)